jgi:hypothetical protein
MARRARNVKEYVDSAREKVNRLVASPLRAIAEKLGQDLDEAECACGAGSLSRDKLIELCSYVSYIINHLPQSFGHRFFFDAAMVRAIAADWGGSLRLSPMVVPSYDPEWGHRIFRMPSEVGQPAHLIDVVLLKGEDRLEDVNLLAYPWLTHELGHYVFFRDDSAFRNAFVPYLANRAQSLALSAIADRGAARVKARAIVDELRAFWTPSPDHRDWAHELAIDVIALWTCGPAYLASFQDEVEQPHKNPYEITQDHPPNEVRLCALAEASRDLRFRDYAEGLLAAGEGWVRSGWRGARDNRFLALADPGLIRACTQAAFRYCESMEFTKWTTSRLDVLRTRLDDEASLELGVDLLLSARVVFRERGEAAFSEWERKTVHRLAQEVKQLSR